MSETLQRKYSVAEIDEMRAIVEFDFPATYNYDELTGCSVRDRSFDASIEDRLRTYMLAGIGPDDLREARGAKLQAAMAEREATERFINASMNIHDIPHEGFIIERKQPTPRP